MSQPFHLADTSIVMAEKSGHDVVEKSLSGGDASLSDVPASTKDKFSAGGDVGEFKDAAKISQAQPYTNSSQPDGMMNDFESETRNTAVGKDTGGSANETSKHGPAPTESKALEMNRISSTSDGGVDTASLGGSESDASRADSKHPRTGTTKKPATFKPISFAKFTVPKAPGTATSPKPAEKATLSSTPTTLGAHSTSTRPRLVAKTTSGIRNSLSKLGSSTAGPGSGPDPNQVWNKNRPAQPTPPKQLSDEELKQQYGIHMTSRIQENGGGGGTEAKWADIEDDEDDWAPEAIEWTDGMKITLTHNEPAPPSPAQPPAQQPPTRQPPTQPAVQPTAQLPPVHENVAPKEPKGVPPPTQQEIVPEAMKAIPKPTTNIGPNPTVLRLGANAERQAKSATVSSKGTTEKPSPASTSPAPIPSKSPWATLPPVEKVSPIIPPLQAQRSPRTSFRETHVSEHFSGPAPPREIAADDFNRSWKEGHPGPPRELFNSRSGRYEPVSETRKGHLRTEQTLRTPSLLQRPTHHEQTGPAEPSVAFQTHRSGAQDAPHWTRRRASSNISGGSGGFGRRMSSGRSDLFQGPVDSRRSSQVNGIADPSIPPIDLARSKETPLREISPSHMVPDLNWQARSPSKVNRAIPAAVPTEPPLSAEGASSNEPGAVPGQVEDAVVLQERIMKEKRMEARQRRQEQEEKEEAAKRERINQKLEAMGFLTEKPKPKSRETSEVGKPPEVAPAPASTTSISQRPPKPPVPERAGEPKQYGVMKVHHPESVRKLVAANEKDRVVEKSASVTNSRQLSSPPHETKSDTMATDGLRQPSEPHAQVHATHSEAKAEESGPQWGDNFGVPNYSPWSPNAKLGGLLPPVAKNPWKSFNGDKALGNGIFEQNLGSFSPRDLHLRGHLSLDQPHIGPPTAAHNRIAGPQPFPVASKPPQELQPLSSFSSPEFKHVNPVRHPTPIGPPSSQQSHWQQDIRRSHSTATWNNFHAVASKREAEQNEKLLREMDTLREGPSSLQANFNETWRRVGTGDQSGQRNIIGVTRSTENETPASNLLPFDHHMSGLPFPDNHTRPFTMRGSRFFPSATEQHKKPAVREHNYRRSPSPPPPEELNHPVFAGASHKPLVHLPTPKPIVKLPPKIVASPSPPPPPPTFASMAARPPGAAAQPISAATIWREKINGLFEKRSLNEKRNALTVASASKEPLDVQLHTATVPVSLPQNGASVLQIGDGEATSRKIEEEEDLFEDREVGSLPVVCVPNMAPPAAWGAARPPPQPRLRSKILKPMQVQSMEPYYLGFFDKDHSGNIRVSIRLPGSSMTKSAILPKKSAPRQRGNFKPRKNTRGQAGSGYLNPKKLPPSQQANGSESSWEPRTVSGSY